ncbi:glycine betaine ABC transporter substrate-binding protein [Sphingomonas sp. KR1UV-12]|uniref:Glycine betaine ABC transporter substrate-binding protein n=1 Tax=Sphingomonas aurea TaxID=3063994 RepID=A0ABT9EKC8_9SPHN|nr:glycine betaine ABC transporter substrate-binding protein [Sphingomonas sp. KR1UV-12]MDP1027401.1 glycine betaine ABC transporter substrate-binding protein [Sphingomonas sp. KR1UV-12]
MSGFLAALSRVPPLLAAHVTLSLAAIALGLAIAAPLAIVAARRPRVAAVALGFASLIQTVPALALLALFFPLLLLVGGGALPALGFLPSLLALTLYALLPLLRNGVASLRGIDPAVIEAADAVGMTPAQKLRLVEAPLAAPVAIAGLRTAAVWTIGAATLSTTVGQPSLGDLIFAGLQTQSWSLVLAGCLAAAALALAVDALMGLVERGIAARRRGLWLAALAVLAGGMLAATAPLWWPAKGGDRPLVTVGAKNFAEQYILARLIGDRLERAGYRVEYRDGLGSAVIFGAVASGAVDVYVDYAGTIWTNEMKRADVPDRAAMLRTIGEWTARTRGVRLVAALGFENAYAFAMREPVARARGIATLADLAAQSPSLRLGSDLEFLERPEWAAVRRAYPMRFAAATPFSPTFMYQALASGRVDAITAFSSDGRIAAEHLRVLTDPKHAIPGYDAILLVAPGRAKDARFLAALRPLAGRIGVEAMRQANYRVDREADKQSPEQAAAWLAGAIRLQ